MKEIIDASGGGGGTGGGVLKIGANQEGVLDKTWQEISDAPFSVLYRPSGSRYNIYYLMEIGMLEAGYIVMFVRIQDATPTIDIIGFYATSPTDYPVFVN